MTEIAYWIETHPMVLLLAFSTVFTFFWLLHLRERLHMRPLDALMLSVLHVVVGVAAVSLFAFLEAPQEYSFGVQSLFGGVFFMPLAYWAWAKVTKRDCSVVFDSFTVCLVFTLMCARVSCLISGCCLGRIIPGTEGIRWPTREAELIYYIVLLIIIIPKVRKKKDRGEIYPSYMMSYGIFRFVNETFRIGSGLLHLSHFWAMISIIIGAGFLLELKSTRKRGGRH